MINPNLPRRSGPGNDQRALTLCAGRMEWRGWSAFDPAHTVNHWGEMGLLW
jgi:hypothetical protein